VLDLQNLTKRREQAGSVFELTIPSLRVEPGQMVALVGDSGCGKSTLLDILALVMQPTRADSFSYRFGGLDVPAKDILAFWTVRADAELARLRREHMGYILQTGGLLSFLSVLDNICLPAKIKGLRNYGQQVQDLTKRLGIDQCLQRKPDALSIGQRQRAAIARALAHGPEFVLADEPTASVDKARARQIMQDLNEVTQEQQAAVVLVTHDPDLTVGADMTYVFDVQQAEDGAVQAICRRAV